MGPSTPDSITVCIDAERLEAGCGTIDALARMALVAKREGVSLELRRVPAELRDLIELVGLSEVLLTPRSTWPRC